MNDVADKKPSKPRVIAADNPYTASILVRAKPTLLEDLDAWLSEVNERIVGARWSRTDLVRTVLEQAVAARPDLLAPMTRQRPAPAPPQAEPKPAPIVAPTPAVERPAPATAVVPADLPSMDLKALTIFEENLRKRVRKLAKRKVFAALHRYFEDHGAPMKDGQIWKWAQGEGATRSWKNFVNRLMLVARWFEEGEPGLVE